jgi:hypothetical protein
MSTYKVVGGSWKVVVVSICNRSLAVNRSVVHMIECTAFYLLFA